jgi:septum formation protein
MAEGTARRLILASGSSSRRQMLTSAGVVFDVVPADVDEAAIRQSLAQTQRDIDPVRVASALAAAKAMAVSARYPEALVIGADQILALEGTIFEKVPDLASARVVLTRLRGRCHALHSAVALATGGTLVWQTIDTARLSMRAFSDLFLDQYLARAGAGILASVGCYHFEGAGAQLFERVDGDYFTILGLPLIPLLGELRRQGVLAA